MTVTGMFFMTPEGMVPATNIPGPPGPDGEPGPGVPTGGTTGQVLAKASDADHDTHWVSAPTGGGGAVDSVNGQTGEVDLDARYLQVWRGPQSQYDALPVKDAMTLYVVEN